MKVGKGWDDYTEYVKRNAEMMSKPENVVWNHGNKIIEIKVLDHSGENVWSQIWHVYPGDGIDFNILNLHSKKPNDVKLRELLPNPVVKA